MARKKLPTVTPAKPPAAPPTYVRSAKHEESPAPPRRRRHDTRNHLVRHKKNGEVLARINLWIPMEAAQQLDEIAEEDRRDKGAILADGLKMYFAHRIKRLPPSTKR